MIFMGKRGGEKEMNKKAAILVCLVLGLVLVPLVAAAPLMQNQNGDTLKTQDQLQTRDCDASCLQTQDASGDCLQTRDCLQTQTQLQTRDCNCTAACTGTCNGTQTQSQQRLNQCQQDCNQTGNMEQYRYGYQHQCQQKNQP
jgi:hypothetical protein